MAGKPAKSARQAFAAALSRTGIVMVRDLPSEVNGEAVSNWRKGTSLPPPKLIGPILDLMFSPAENSDRDYLEHLYRAAWNESAEILKKPKLDKAGAIWLASGPVLAKDRTARASDRRVASDESQRRLQADIRDLAAEIAAKTKRPSYNSDLLERLSMATSAIRALLDVDTATIPRNLSLLYRRSLELGEILETDLAVRADHSDAPLDAGIRGQLTTLVQVNAAWLYEFPSIVRLDRNAANAQGADRDFLAPSRPFVQCLLDCGVIDARDGADLLEALQAADTARRGGKSGLPVEKFIAIAQGDATNLLLAAARDVIVARRESPSHDATDRDRTQRLARAFVDAAPAVTTMTAKMGANLRQAFIALLEECKTPPPPRATAGMSETKPGAPEKWYVSYSWGDTLTPEGIRRDKAVEELCEKARAQGHEILRDKTAMAVGDRISEFMRRLGQADRVFVILSEKYLRSTFCMFELSEIWRNSRQEDSHFLSRVRVFTLPDAKIGTARDRLRWATFWKDVHDALEKEINNAGIRLASNRDLNELKWMGRFYAEVGDILATLADIVRPRTIDELLAYGFADKAAPSFDKPSWANDSGTDDFGRWASFSIPTQDGGTVSQKLRWIPPDRFWMGSPDDEDGRDDDEGPRREVTIADGFWLFDTACTQALWQAVMDNNPSRFPDPLRPVERVSFNDVAKFLAKLNARVAGLNLSLPSEARWEYACRAGTETARYQSDLDAIAWYNGNSGDCFDHSDIAQPAGRGAKPQERITKGTRRVATKAANPWGLYDMLGNVWEWCEDTWHDRYEGGPLDGSAWLHTDARPRGAANRVLRGGSWYGGARLVRSACRIHLAPDDRDDSIGFRCARIQSA